LTVFYHVGGTARPRVDYQALSGHITIPAGASSADITVTPIADVDTTPETNETVVVRLVPPILPLDDPSGPMRWPAPYVVGFPSNAIVNIAESGLVTNFPPQVRIVCPMNGAKFPAPAHLVLVAQAEDIDDKVTTVQFFAGTNSLGVTTNREDLPGPFPGTNLIKGAFVLNWSDVAAGDYTITAKATDSRGVSSVSDPITIHVIEWPVVTVVASDPNASEIGPDTGTFKVSRTGGTDNELHVLFALGGTAKPGVDFRLSPSLVTIPVGSSSVDITVTPIADVDAT